MAQTKLPPHASDYIEELNYRANACAKTKNTWAHAFEAKALIRVVNEIPEWLKEMKALTHRYEHKDIELVETLTKIGLEVKDTQAQDEIAKVLSIYFEKEPHTKNPVQALILENVKALKQPTVPQGSQNVGLDLIKAVKVDFVEALITTIPSFANDPLIASLTELSLAPYLISPEKGGRLSAEKKNASPSIEELPVSYYNLDRTIWKAVSKNQDLGETVHATIELFKTEAKNEDNQVALRMATSMEKEANQYAPKKSNSFYKRVTGMKRHDF